MELLFDPLTLLYHWPYGRYGINFHPPLAGQLNLAAYAIFGHWLKDIPARRMATVLEFAVTILIGFRFLARRYGVWIGLVMAGSLLLMPRIYGQAHLIDTDTPGLLLWAATSLAFWKGLYEARGRRWRMAVGILVGLAFIEKLGAVVVLVPLVLWMIAGHLLRTAGRPGRSTIGSMVFSQPGRCWLRWRWHFSRSRSCNSGSRLPCSTDLFVDRPASDWSGAILAVPLGDMGAQALARAIVSDEPVVGHRAAGTRDLDSYPGFCSGPWLGWATRPGGAKRCRDWPTITPSATSGARASGHPDHLLRPGLRIQSPVA